LFVTLYDAQRLILFGLHTGEALTDQEFDDILTSIHRATADGLARWIPTVSVTLVETSNTLNAVQRKRIAAAMSECRLGYHALVTDSILARAAMTAIRWLTRSADGYQQSTHATYEEARVWLVERTRHPAAVFDALHAEARTQVMKAQESSEQGSSVGQGATISRSFLSVPDTPSADTPSVLHGQDKQLKKKRNR
jgi:hypothetical protein